MTCRLPHHGRGDGFGIGDDRLQGEFRRGVGPFVSYKKRCGAGLRSRRLMAMAGREIRGGRGLAAVCCRAARHALGVGQQRQQYRRDDR